MSDHKKHPGGRPTLYKPQYAAQAELFCKMGADDQQLAELFDVRRSTISNWKLKHPEFLGALRHGKMIADANVAAALYKSAMGLHVSTEDKIVSDGAGGQKKMTIEKQNPPSVKAQIFWLKNRQPGLWKDKIGLQQESNLNVFPPKEELDAIYNKALAEAAIRNRALVGRRERLGALIDHAGFDDD
jgi:hypothetical protein